MNSVCGCFDVVRTLRTLFRILLCHPSRVTAADFPAKGYEGFAVGFVQIGTVQRFDEIGSDFAGACQGVIPAESVHFGVIAA
jgi:hypothetical protein